MNIEAVLTEKKCTGCRACEMNCPVHAISFCEDKEGFLSPSIDNALCVDCGKCLMKCPSNAEYRKKESSVGFIVQNKARKQTKKSASGGVFLGLATHFLEKGNAVVMGAAVCDDRVVRHIAIDRKEDIVRLQNSKYVQSDIGNAYAVVFEALSNGKTVLFSGTPCQIAGLCAAIPKQNLENLYTVDIVCHGVPSPAFLRRSLEEASKTGRGRVTEYTFRHKNPNGKSASAYLMMMRRGRGVPIVRKPENDPYYNLFMKGMSFRESCYQCKYACLSRPGDFTIGDCDSQREYTSFHPMESNSILLLNSEKARAVWGEVKSNFDFDILNLERETQCNHQLSHPVERSAMRDGLYDALLHDDWDNVVKRFSALPSKSSQYKLLVLSYFPSRLLRFLAKLKKKHKPH